MIALLRLTPILFAVAVLGVTSASAADAAIEDFFGNYIGRSVSDGSHGFRARDLGASIRPADKGFTLKWTTFTHSASGKPKRKSYAIKFRSTSRSGIYESAMRKNVFGGEMPLDPLKGDPFVWAKISGQTLTVYALIITDEGGYEMQIYDRTLTDTGLDLTFSRLRDGVPFKEIKASLSKVP